MNISVNNRSIPLFKSMRELVGCYDSFIIDVYGVLYDGSTLYDGVLETLKFMKDSNKRVVILSNTTSLSEDAIVKFGTFGLRQSEHFDTFITSGDVFKSEGFPSSEVITYKHLFTPNTSLFTAGQWQEVDSIEAADYVYVGIPRTASGNDVCINGFIDQNSNSISVNDLLTSEWDDLVYHNGEHILVEFSTVLKECRRYNKKLICVNPDIFAFVDMNSAEGTVKVPVIRQGAVALYYQRLGGEVMYFGKPFNVTYEYVFKSTGIERNGAVMIGDTPWTDILGAHNAGIESIMTLTGAYNLVSKEFPELSISENFEKLISSFPMALAEGYSRELFYPYKIVECF